MTALLVETEKVTVAFVRRIPPQAMKNLEFSQTTLTGGAVVALASLLVGGVALPLRHQRQQALNPTCLP